MVSMTSWDSPVVAEDTNFVALVDGTAVVVVVSCSPVTFMALHVNEILQYVHLFLK